METCDVAVVGGGPVGAAAALALTRCRFDVRLVERAARPPAFAGGEVDPRVYAISPRSAAVLGTLGVWPWIAAARASPYAAMRVWVDSPERGLRFEAADAGRGELGWIVEHGLIADALWAALETDTAHVRCGIEIERIELDAGSPRLHLEDGSRLQARLLVAADGADSRLRREAGIDSLGWRYAQRAIVCHVRTERPHRAIAWQRFLVSGPLAFLPLADGRCSIVWSVEEAQAAELMALGDAAFCERLAEAGQALGAVLETTPRRCVPLRLLHAVDYARPGVVLVGDAAHSVHPLAGQGVNLGLADVAALAQTLAEARDAGRDWSAPRALARYARSRKADNLEMLALTDALYRAFRTPLPGLRSVLGFGMNALDGLGPLKTWFARQALGGRGGEGRSDRISGSSFLRKRESSAFDA